MSARRAPSAPPSIPGFSHVRLLGMGGFADVFLYEQQMPRRTVAVKVLLAGSLSEEVRERFRVEADLMARLSHHPSIVTVHHADVAADGRPYLVMEYCSRRGLGERYRTERMGVAEVLRIGVRLASAVESAHRAGVLHRDIKPANVLVTDFGWPALTDFGIAATTGAVAAVGMSIPWAPPELLTDEPEGDERSDVYSLAATVYSLLAGRTPFEVPGGSNTAADLVARIERSPLPDTGRPDVPPSLHAVLERAMAKEPAHRPATALAFARALQQVEAELLLPVTALDLPEEPPGLPEEDTREAPVDDQATRLRPVVTVSPEAAPARTPPPATPDGRTPPSAEELLEQWRRAVGEEEDSVERASPGRGRVVAAAVSAVVLLAAAVTVVVLALDSPPTVAPTPEPSATTTTPATVVAVPAPTDVVGVRVSPSQVRFTWANPEPEAGDSYLWGVVATGQRTELERVTEPTVLVDAEGDVCIEVAIVRADRRATPEPVVGCVRDG